MTLTRAQWAIASHMPEADLLSRVRVLCDDFGLLAIHYERSDLGKCWVKGDPDLRIYGPGGLLHAELKSERGTLSPDQRRVGSMLTRAGLRWVVWRPHCLFDGTIQRQLSGIAAVQDCSWKD